MPTHAPNHDPQEFAHRLRKALDRAGLPSGRGAGAMLAKRHKVSTVTANAWLKGTHLPTPERARQISDDLRCNHDWLYFGRSPSTRLEEPEHPAYLARPQLPDDELRLLGAYRGATDAGKELILEMAKKTAKLLSL